MANLNMAPSTHILVVDDHRDSVVVASRLLRGRGYRVSMATSYEEALAVAAAEPIDLLVSDTQLGDGDGCDLLKEMVRLYPQIRGVALTGHGYAIDRRRCQEAGYGEFLLKPVLSDQLFKAVGRALQERPAVSPAGSQS